MQLKKPTIYMFIVFSLLVGCGHNDKTTVMSHAPTVAEELKQNQNVDIFLLDNTVYKTNIDWVNQLSLTKKKLIGKIETQYSIKSDEPFKNRMATKLPIGSKIYSTNERNDVLIVQCKGKEKKYYKLTEG